MAEERISANKKKSLPPLSPKGDGDSEPKPVKRKIKKKVPRPEENGTVDEGNAEEVKPRPKQRRKRSPSQARDSEADTPANSAKDGATSPTGAPKKKKKKPKAVTEEGKEPGGEGGETPKQENQGSKTSLLTKEGETPRKKGGKKKKKVKKAVKEEDEFGESPWADDLRTMEEDIITAGDKEGEGDEEEEVGGDTKEGSAYKKKDLKTTSILVPSRPLDKIFVETSTKFKGLERGILTKQMAEEEINATITSTPVVTRQTTIDFALASHRMFRVVTLFLHGLTAGLCLWLLVTIFKLTSFSKEDFLEHYYETSMPLQCSLYFLLVLCTVSACDRFDIGNPTPRFILRSLTLQNGTVSIILYLVALILNLIALRYEDRIFLYKEQQPDTTFATTPNPADYVSEDDIDMFKSLNTARCVFAILGWCVLAITPNCDRLGKNLQSGETGLETELNMDKVSQA